jgi:antitoxin (DNA-binding transcriptional repressor) of toxin-antitoxin stability system
MAKATAPHKTETTSALKEPGDLLDRIQRGETIVLTRHRRVVAVLRPPTEEERNAYGPVAA